MKTRIIAVLLMLGLVSDGYGQGLLFTFTGTGSGSAGSTLFADVPFTIVVSADPSKVETLTKDSAPFGYSVDGSFVTVQIAGVGSGSFLESTRIFVNHGAITVGFARGGVTGLDLMDFRDPALAGFDIRAPFGPTQFPSATPESLTQFREVSSTLGPISFNSLRDITFSAVPEPSAWAMLVLGTCLLSVGFRSRGSEKHI